MLKEAPKGIKAKKPARPIQLDGCAILMWKAIIFFGLLGPVIGSFVFVGTNAFQVAEFQIFSVSEIGSKLGEGILGTLFIGIWGIPFALLFGMVPAGVSGYAYWVISRNLKLINPSAIKRFIVGSAISLIITTILFIAFYLYNNHYHDSDESFFYGWWFFAWPGYVAGGVCGLFVKANS